MTTLSSSLKPLQDALKQEIPPSVVYILGKEPFLVQQALGLLKETLLTAATKDFNSEVFRGDEVTGAQIQAAARMIPMLGKYRLVLVQDAEELVAAQLNQLLPYLDAPNTSTCLCFISQQADMRTKFMTKIKQVGLYLPLEPLQERQLPAFVKAEAQRFQVKLGKGVSEYVIAQVGSDLTELSRSLDKLSCYVELGAEVTLEDAAQCLVTTRTHTVFELLDAIGQRDLPKSLSLLDSLLKNKEPALRLLAMLVRHIRQLWIARDVLTSSRSAGATEVAKAAGVPPFVAFKLVDQARKFDRKFIETMHEEMYQTDRLLKRSRVDDARYMEELVIKLAS